MKPEEIAEKMWDKHCSSPEWSRRDVMFDIDFDDAIKEAIELHEASKPNLLYRMATQLRSMRKDHDPTGRCHCLTCYQIVALLAEYDKGQCAPEVK